MWDVEEAATKLAALGHPTRLMILMELTKGENYLSEIANKVGISRALAKVHLKKLREAGLVESRVMVMEDEARALRFYKINEFEVSISPERLAEEVKKRDE
ncbi:MAG: ArsR/SmtB family transcription factor [bacterium]|jgi:ArsR family transcriptional regulator